MERKLVEVAWEITDRCNFNCVHCYNARNRDDLSYSQILNVLEQLKKIGVEKIKYGGGEPLVRKDFLDILAKTISMGFDVTFSTNGYLIEPKTVQKIKDSGLTRIQVSLDGNEGVHNFLRQNSSAYSGAVNAINLFAQNDFKVSVATTLVKPNLNCLEDIFDVCSNLKANRWRVMKYLPVISGDLTPTPREYFEAHKTLMDLSKRNNDSLEVYVAREFDEICEQKDRFDSECFGGRTVASIRANGDVSPCSYFTGIVVGNLKTQSMRDLWNDSKMLEFSEEVFEEPNCSFFKNCRGGCKAASFYIRGFGGCDPYCWVRN